MLDSSRRLLFCVGLGVLAGVFFLLDWLLPVGTTMELLQVAVILLTLFVPGRAPTVGSRERESTERKSHPEQSLYPEGVRDG